MKKLTSQKAVKASWQDIDWFRLDLFWSGLATSFRIRSWLRFVSV